MMQRARQQAKRLDVQVKVKGFLWWLVEARVDLHTQKLHVTRVTDEIECAGKFTPETAAEVKMLSPFGSVTVCDLDGNPM